MQCFPKLTRWWTLFLVLIKWLMLQGTQFVKHNELFFFMIEAFSAQWISTSRLESEYHSYWILQNNIYKSPLSHSSFLFLIPCKQPAICMHLTFYHSFPFQHTFIIIKFSSWQIISHCFSSWFNHLMHSQGVTLSNQPVLSKSQCKMVSVNSYQGIELLLT